MKEKIIKKKQTLTSDFRSSFCITMCLALLPEMLMCSWSLSISCPVPSWSISSFSSFFSNWLEAPAWFDRTGGDARTGFTKPTWGSTGMGGRTGVTPSEKKRLNNFAITQWWYILGSVLPLVLPHQGTHGPAAYLWSLQVPARPWQPEVFPFADQEVGAQLTPPRLTRQLQPP